MSTQFLEACFLLDCQHFNLLCMASSPVHLILHFTMFHNQNYWRICPLLLQTNEMDGLCLSYSSYITWQQYASIAWRYALIYKLYYFISEKNPSLQIVYKSKKNKEKSKSESHEHRKHGDEKHHKKHSDSKKHGDEKPKKHGDEKPKKHKHKDKDEVCWLYIVWLLIREKSNVFLENGIKAVKRHEAGYLSLFCRELSKNEVI